MARSATLLYGGDLREDGFTQFILEEAIALKNRLNTDDIHVENHLAWPLYMTDSQITAWRAKYTSVMKTVEYEAPNDIVDTIDTDKFLPPSSTDNKYVWSRCLTEMRFKSIDSSNTRICAGGKLSGYSGKMPGVLEEILIALEKKKPIYLLGAFGGVVGEVCDSITNRALSEKLSEDWQVTHNSGYKDLQDLAGANNQQADYQQIKTVIEEITITSLAENVGLDEDHYNRLMCTPFIDEIVYLIIKGLKINGV